MESDDGSVADQRREGEERMPTRSSRRRARVAVSHRAASTERENGKGRLEERSHWRRDRDGGRTANGRRATSSSRRREHQRDGGAPLYKSRFAFLGKRRNAGRDGRPPDLE